MQVKIKGKVYRRVVIPALLYRAETWALKKAQENKLEVGLTRRHITNDIPVVFERPNIELR